jgi:hypothetical protein
MVLSTIRIPIQWSQPTTQHEQKNKKRTAYQRRPIAWRRFLWYPLLLFTFMSAPCVHTLPGTNHALVSGDTSLDQARQHSFVNNIVDETVSNLSDPDDLIACPTTAALRSGKSLRRLPYCFVADTDSVKYVIDTGANCIIIQNKKIFSSFRLVESSVKGVGGNAVKAHGVGTVRIPLKSDDGIVDYITVNAVYVPSCPFNLVPPQVLMTEMKAQGYTIANAEHDELEYTIT